MPTWNSLKRPRPLPLRRSNRPFIHGHDFSPRTRVDEATVERSLVADGCIIESGTRIENSVIGLRCHIGRDVTIRNSIVMGADFYEMPDELRALGDDNLPPLGHWCRQ